MHLSYVLELPERPSNAQHAFKIALEAGFALSIRNLEAGSPAGAGLSEEQKPTFPQQLQKEMASAVSNVRMMIVMPLHVI